MALNFANPIYCVITGASRGIGRTIAIETARRAKNKVVLVLIARSEKNLNETRDIILKTNINANVHCVSLDLYKPDTKEYDDMLKSTLIDLEGDYTAVMFHNAGHIGTLDKVINLSDVKVWQDYYSLNVVSVTILNSSFINHVKNTTKNIFVINITSLLGRKGFSYFGMYGSGKAARDLYFKVLAEEEKDLRILSWSPGLVATEMSDEVLTELDRFGARGEGFTNVLTTEQTVNKLFKVLDENKFTSGDIIDYYDVE